MLQVLRERAQGVIAWIIIILLSAAFALWGISNYFYGDAKKDVVIAKVNGEKIYQHQVDNTYQQLKRQQEIQFGPDFTTDQQSEDLLKQQALQQIIHNTVLTQAARKQGYRIAPQQVDTALLSMPVFQQDGQFSKERFQNFLRATGNSATGFLKEVQNYMAVSQFRSGVMGSAFVLPDEVNRTVELIEQKRDVKYLKISANNLTDTINVSDKEIASFYEQNKEQFISPEKIKIDYVVLDMAEILKRYQPTPAQIKQYYDDNADQFTTAPQWQVSHILIRLPNDADEKQIADARKKMADIENELKQGKSFSELAKKYSDDVISAKNGGEIGWISAGSVDPSFERAVTTLTKPGENSTPVVTKYGLDLIHLNAIKPETVIPLAQVKDRIVNLLQNQQAQQQFSDSTDQLANVAFESPESLQPVANALKLAIQHSDWLTQNDVDKQSITHQVNVIKAAFSDEVLKSGNNSDVIAISPTQVVVLRMAEHVVATQKSLTDVKQQIATQLRQAKIQTQTLALAKQIQQQLIAGQDVSALIAQHHLTWQTKNDVTRHDQSVDASIVEEVFEIPKSKSGNSNNTAIAIALPSGDSAVIEVTKVIEGDIKQLKPDEVKAFQTKIADVFGIFDYDLYSRGLMQQANIKTETINQTNDE